MVFSEKKNWNEGTGTAVTSTTERLRQAFFQRGISYGDLAKATGIGKSVLQRYIVGETQKIPTQRLVSIAQALDVSPAALLGWEDAPASATVPLLGEIACGTPLLAQENLLERVSLPHAVHADFALRCQGDSMVGARIYSGDLVYIRRQETVENGEIAAVLLGSEATLKRVYHQPGAWLELRAENPHYPPLRYEGAAMAEARILGKAVAFLSTVR